MAVDTEGDTFNKEACVKPVRDIVRCFDRWDGSAETIFGLPFEPVFHCAVRARGKVKSEQSGGMLIEFTINERGQEFLNLITFHEKQPSNN